MHQIPSNPYTLVSPIPVESMKIIKKESPIQHTAKIQNTHTHKETKTSNTIMIHKEESIEVNFCNFFL